MTTILADARIGVMVSDSNITDGDRVWVGRKVFRHRGHLLGVAGELNEVEPFLRWWKEGCKGRTPRLGSSTVMVMSVGGLMIFSDNQDAERIQRGYEAIGSGGKAAICAYEAMGLENPVRAVSIVCRHDSDSRPPVRTYRL